MAASDTAPPATSAFSDWLLELAIGVVVVALGLSAWAFSHFSGKHPRQDLPKPVWLSMSKVMAQMGDGRMVNVKVNLRLAKDGDASLLEPHKPAFKALIEEAGSGMSRDELQGSRGMKHFAKAIKGAINGYLQSQDVDAKVRDVAFEDMMLMP